MKIDVQPRLLRPQQAHAYLGMSRPLFEKLVRNNVPEMRLGDNSLAFDRLDLDRWVEQTKDADVSRRSVVDSTGEGERLCQEATVKCQDSSSVMGSGGLTRGSKESQVAAFEKARRRGTTKKPKGT